MKKSRCPRTLALLLVSAPLAAGQEAAPTPTGSLFYDDGFHLRSADGRNELVIEGLLQFDALWNGRDREPETDFDLKRMRLEFSGRFLDDFRLKLEPNFKEDGVELEEAWFGVRLEDATLMLGRMKGPFGLEEVRSRKNIDFTRFSILNQFSPAEDDGVFLYGLCPSGVVEYNAALYNGTGTSDTTGTKDVAARVSLHPFAEDAGSRWQNLEFGLAATIGSQDQDVGGDHIKNAAGGELLEYAPGTRLDGTRYRVGLELAWFHGPFFMQAEALHLVQEMDGAGRDPDVSFDGAYLNLSYVLTGESKTFGGVRPEHPTLGAGSRGWGAWVLAARYSHLECDDDLLDDGLVLPTSYTDAIDSYWLGLNWYPAHNAIVRTSYVHSEYSDSVEIDGASRSSEDSLQIGFQLSF